MVISNSAFRQRLHLKVINNNNYKELKMLDRDRERKINWGYLIPLVSTLTLGCANVGFVIAGNN